MVAFNFTVFQDKVTAGTKRQTIRKSRRGSPGDRIQLYTGMRTKKCRKLCEDQTLGSVIPVTLHANKVCVGINTFTHEMALEGFALRDGFEPDDNGSAWSNMVKFFELNNEEPWTGFLHTW